MNRNLKISGGLAAAFVILILANNHVQDWFINRCGKTIGAYLGLSLAQHLVEEPPLMLWAWEYPTDLNGIDTKKVGVAYLAGKFVLQSDTVFVKPRIQRLNVPDNTFMTAVMRIEADHTNVGATFSDAQLNELAFKIISLLSQRKVQMLQIDFDARLSERPFYHRLLAQLRERLPDDMPISITALASWCLGDKWLTDTQCDQVVPMFFSMGKDRERMLLYLQTHRDFQRSQSKLISLGLSIDEPDVLAQLDTLTSTTFLFSRNGWQSDYAKEWISTIQNGGLHWKNLAQAN